MSDVNTIFAEIRKLSLEDQRALNSLIVANIRGAMRVKAVSSAIKYNRGDVVKFDGKTRGTIIIEITGFSRDFTIIKGKQLNSGFKTSAGVPWTVAATLVSPSTREEALRISR